MIEYLRVLEQMSDFFNSIKEFFSNPSVAAFIGAFAAFSFIILTDLRRNRRKKKLINQLLHTNLKFCKDKIWAIDNIINTLEKKKQLIGGPLQPFRFEHINNMSLSILDLLRPDEQATLETICFHMQEINNLVNEAACKCERLRNLEVDSKQEQSNILITIKNYYIDARDNIHRLEDFINFYLQKVFKSIHEIIYKRINPPVVKND